VEISIMDIRAIGNSAPLPQAGTELKSSAPSTSRVDMTTTLPAEINKEPSQASTDQIKQAVEDINQSMKQQLNGLEFVIDEDTNRSVVKVIDSETKEVIRQFPSQETLQIAKSLDDTLGKIINEQA
jgi:flagellar protein FlaG